MNKQKGVSISGLLILAVVLIVVALLGLKVAPPYMEYLQIKKTIAAMVESGEARNATVADIRKAYERRAAVDNLESVSAQDLEISKDGADIVISFAYPKKVPLFGNVSILFEFSGSSRK